MIKYTKPNARKLSAEDVTAIRRRLNYGEKQAHLAIEYGVSKQTINNVLHGKKHYADGAGPIVHVDRLHHTATIARFWGKVARGAPDECWPYTGSRLPSGYGTFWSLPDGKKIYAHRYALELSLGKPLGDSYACHTCDNPQCCNPSHLFVGDAVANVQDMRAKGRDKYTETAEIVREYTQSERHRQASRIRMIAMNKARACGVECATKPPAAPVDSSDL